MRTRTAQGALWRKWDLHIHTPASFHPNGRRFHKLNAEERAPELKKIVEALNHADAAVFGVMDYWTFDGYIALRQHVKLQAAGYLTKTVLPGIELRLVAPTEWRLNAHALFSDELTDQQLNDFKSKLVLALIKKPLSHERLIEFGRALGADKLKKHGFDHAKVKTDDDEAWLAGASTAEITAESFLEAFDVIPKDKALVFMPWDTNDGLAELDWVEHYAYARTFISRPEIFESRGADKRCAFVGEKTEKNAKYFDAFQTALGNKPRLVVSGSDGHAPDQYAKFPGEKATWIKAEPSFLGLLQAIKEPAQRSFIGDKPPKAKLVESRKTLFADRVEVVKVDGGLPAEEWFNGVALPFSHDLVAIIGNKGSGKSALADIIALLGDAKNSSYFTFLNARRFRSASNSRAQYFTGRLTWASGERKEAQLSDDPEPESVERIKYIPQEFFEELCNEHVEGKTDKLEQELRQVIFSHIDLADALGQTSFEALLNLKEREIIENQRALRADLSKLNARIEFVESRQHPSVRQALEAKLAQKAKEIEEHDKLKPVEVAAPAAERTPEQKEAIEKIAQLEAAAAKIATTIAEAQTERRTQADRLAAAGRLQERLKQVKRYVENLRNDLASDLTALSLSLDQLLSVNIDPKPLRTIEDDATERKKVAEKALSVSDESSAAFQLDAARKEQSKLREALDEPNKKYQEYLERRKEWEARRATLVGDNETPDTLNAITAELAALGKLPDEKTALTIRRAALAREILKTIDAQRKLRESLYAPVQGLIERNPLIRDEYKLQFQTFLGLKELDARLFEFVRQNTGTFRGDDEGKQLLREMLEKHDVQTEDGAVALADELLHAVQFDLRTEGQPAVEMAKVLRVGKTPRGLYDFLYAFEYLEPRYSLLFQETPIEKLSPGQRGALLLIFYLLVDRDQAPIVLDQPEENLDNETVVSLLVPVVKEAKQRRQVIMVTHNPNLAVVCDAEQIIHAHFDRKDKHKVTYTSGPIEDPAINKLVVDVLEGTKKAFDNRGGKYQEQSDG